LLGPNAIRDTYPYYVDYSETKSQTDTTPAHIRNGRGERGRLLKKVLFVMGRL